jgi:DNA modification methylase
LKNRDPNSSKFAQLHNYLVVNVTQARKIVNTWLKDKQLLEVISLGLPEIDDRFHIWRVPLVKYKTTERIGEVTIDAKNSLIIKQKTTTPEILESRLLQRKPSKRKRSKKQEYILSDLRNTIALGDSIKILKELPAQSIDLVFTSPPYFNVKPEYSDYVNYEEYLLIIRKVIHNVKRVLRDGGFFVMNVSPVLIRRSSRQESSKRIAVPFDMHSLFIKEEFDFIDDIIWQKPEGAGWATGRGRRFAADRNPLQYKPVPITEYLLVYRKHSDNLIDWHIRNHPKSELVKESKIKNGYEKTNIWKISPSHSKVHPAVFPKELASKVITYYSFKEDVVLDPFAGIGTVAEASVELGRRFVIIDNEKKYIDYATEKIQKQLGEKSKDIFYINYIPKKQYISPKLDKWSKKKNA